MWDTLERSPLRSLDRLPIVRKITKKSQVQVIKVETEEWPKSFPEVIEMAILGDTKNGTSGASNENPRTLSNTNTPQNLRKSLWGRILATLRFIGNLTHF